TAEKSAFAQNNDVVTENINNESDTSSPIALNTQDKMPSDMDANMKPDIRIPTTGDKKLPMEPSNKREKNADEQDAFERLVEDHDDSKTELAAAKTAEKDGNYLRIECTSKIMRFVDDLELKIDGNTLIVRSESRVGYSDFGVNRKRAEQLRTELSKAELIK
ncbi:putative translocation protein in type III secretion, partial [Vibrio parahaemolyticus AQ3810]